MPYSYLRDDSINDKYFRFVANYTYDWESWHDPRGELVWVNEAVERMTGYTVQQCLTMSDYPLPIVAPIDVPRMRQMLADAIEMKSHNDLEFQIVTRSGETRWMAVSWQPMYGEFAKHLGFRTSVRDITDRQSLREQLRLHAEHLEQLVEQRTTRIAQLEKHRLQMSKLAALGELAAGVAHEINNPLAGIRNAFSLFQTGLPREHEHFELLEMIDREIERISSIIHQMFQLYRCTPQQPSWFTLEKTIHEVICLLDPIAQRHQVRLEIVPEGQTTKVYLPEGELKQVLFNLARNAIQASSVGQAVTIHVSTRHSVLTIKITDQGTGIPENILPHIFEPFFSTKSELKEGMGLGLSVSRNLVETMEGKIDVETAVGQGTTFTISLPSELNAESTEAGEALVKPVS